MAMSSAGKKGAMADINVTPLVDVLLVLLIIFMITAPIITQKVKIDLPQPNPNVHQPDNPKQPIHLKIDQGGQLYWNDTPVDELGVRAQMAVIAQSPVSDQPEIQIEGNDNVEYQYVAKVLADAKSYNLTKIGFTDNGQ